MIESDLLTMRELKEIHIYPSLGFNDIQFRDRESYIRDRIGDPFVKMESPGEKTTISVYNGGNLLLWFTRDTKELVRIQYDINQPSRTRFYLFDDPVSPYTMNILDWICEKQIPYRYSNGIYRFDALHMEIFSIPINAKRNLRRILLEIDP